MIRAFIAIPIEDAAGSAIIKIIDALKSFSGGAGADVKWVENNNIHLTLKFLGTIDEQQAERVKEAMNSLHDMEPFRMDLNEIGAFPSISRPRVLWIGIKQQEQVKALFDKMEAYINDIRGEDRPFAAHITIGRVKGRFNSQGLEKIKKLWNDKIISSSFVDRIVLFQSILSPKGAVYRSLYTVGLKKEVL
jgi:2'-5' RNA ligase